MRQWWRDYYYPLHCTEGKLKHREVKQLVQSHTARNGRDRTGNQTGSACLLLWQSGLQQSGTKWDKGSRQEARTWERQGLECWGTAAACPAPWKLGGAVVTAVIWAVMGLSLEGNITLETSLKESFRKTKSLSNILWGTRNYRVLVWGWNWGPREEHMAFHSAWTVKNTLNPFVLKPPIQRHWSPVLWLWPLQLSL